jgi:hypothetical protein
MREGVVDGLDGERGGLALLAAAIEDAAADVRIEHLGLDGVRVEVEHGVREGDGLRLGVVLVKVLNVLSEHTYPALRGETEPFAVVRP